MFLSKLIQENGADGDLQVLRQIIQKCEANGMVDFELANHNYSRPAIVVQGRSADTLGPYLSFYCQCWPLTRWKSQSVCCKKNLEA